MTMPSTGPISLQNARTTFSDSGDTRMNELYRGGALVPSTRSTSSSTLGPWSAFTYSSGPNDIFWSQLPGGGNVSAWWDGAERAASSANVSSLTAANGDQYERGSFQFNNGFDFYSVRRRINTVTTTFTSINTQVPSANTISLSQLYGAVAS